MLVDKVTPVAILDAQQIGAWTHERQCQIEALVFTARRLPRLVTELEEARVRARACADGSGVRDLGALLQRRRGELVCELAELGLGAREIRIDPPCDVLRLGALIELGVAESADVLGARRLFHPWADLLERRMKRWQREVARARVAPSVEHATSAPEGS